MNKKTLEQKIKDIIFYAIIFCALYLIIGFLIKSQWLTSFSESWNYSYELIRDALTLTAYFLAPTAAFVLFSDWREQHTEVKIEAEAERIVKTILQINTDIDSVDIDIRNNFNKIHNQD